MQKKRRERVNSFLMQKQNRILLPTEFVNSLNSSQSDRINFWKESYEYN